MAKHDLLGNRTSLDGGIRFLRATERSALRKRQSLSPSCFLLLNSIGWHRLRRPRPRAGQYVLCGERILGDRRLAPNVVLPTFWDIACLRKAIPAFDPCSRLLPLFPAPKEAGRQVGAGLHNPEKASRRLNAM